MAAALIGQNLIDTEARSRKRFWISPAVVARLLLARRIVRRLPEHGDYRCARILGLIIPEFDRLAMEAALDITQAGRLIVPLHLHPTLLAGVAIIMRAGPRMLEKIRSYAMGDTYQRLKALFSENGEHWFTMREPTQGQLI